MPQFQPSNDLPFVILQEVDSTNNYAMARIHEGGVQHGAAWLALHQTSGKGQRGGKWRSEPGENILMSIVFRPQGLLLKDQFMLNISVALGVYDFVKNVAGPSVRIKWSNDIYVGDKKAAGILIENVTRGQAWLYAIAGIGVNLNQDVFPPDVPNPVSLSRATGKKYDLLEMTGALYRQVLYRCNYLQPATQNQLLEEYVSCLYHIGEKQGFSSGEEKFEAVIKGVEKNGKLILEKDGKRISVHSGEICFII